MNKVRLNEKLIKTFNSVLFMSASEMRKAAGIATTTWYHFMQQPSVITIQQLLAIANGLHIPVRRFFSTGRYDIVGQREDYIAEPYIPCRYDADILQNIISTRSDATWQKASEVSGVTPSRLKNSLIGATRTPVTRFLTVCAAFDIDPFTILIDPNPEPPKGNHAINVQNKLYKRNNDEASLRNDIAILQQRIDDLNDTITDLTKKFQVLLSEHDKLAQRVSINSVNIENINNAGDININPEPTSDFGI